jgi:hypothetical protein
MPFFFTSSAQFFSLTIFTILTFLCPFLGWLFFSLLSSLFLLYSDDLIILLPLEVLKRLDFLVGKRVFFPATMGMGDWQVSPNEAD